MWKDSLSESEQANTSRMSFSFLFNKYVYNKTELLIRNKFSFLKKKKIPFFYNNHWYKKSYKVNITVNDKTTHYNHHMWTIYDIY